MKRPRAVLLRPVNYSHALYPDELDAPLTEEETERLGKLAASWDLWEGSAPQVLGDLALPEALLHEVCHAVVLGIPISRRAPTFTSRFFEGRVLSRLALLEEAATLAVEVGCIPSLGWEWSPQKEKQFLGWAWKSFRAEESYRRWFFRELRQFLYDDNTANLQFAASREFKKLAVPPRRLLSWQK